MILTRSHVEQEIYSGARTRAIDGDDGASFRQRRNKHDFDVGRIVVIRRQFGVTDDGRDAVDGHLDVAHALEIRIELDLVDTAVFKDGITHRVLVGTWCVHDLELGLIDL